MILFKKTALFIYLCVGLMFIANAQNNRLPLVKLPSFKNDTFNIITYGAKADVATLNTKAIQDTINDCSESVGGVVIKNSNITSAWQVAEFEYGADKKDFSIQ